MSYTFSKPSRLKSSKAIEELVALPSFFCHPYVVYRRPLQDANNDKIAISVPRKKIAKAVHRNLIKRRIREAYRQKEDHRTTHYELLLIYALREVASYNDIQKGLEKVFQKISLT